MGDTLNSVDLMKWAGIIQTGIELGVTITNIVAMIRSVLTEEECNVVLNTVKKKWQDARTENDARIAELEVLVG